MATKPDSYPSPSAAQAGGGVVGAYQQGHQDPGQDALDLQQLQAAADGTTASHPHPPPQHHDGGATAAHINSGAGLASAVAQHLNSQESYYAQPPQASTPQPFQGQIPGISGPLPTTPGDDSARKKTKVTRACDECRRKKIKCDAENDGPSAARCSNCQRTNAECRFSRAPQKRGPSKGYIKELSDRVAQLESVGRGPGYPDFEQGSPGPLGTIGERKRTFSMTEPGMYESPSLDKYRPEPPKSFAPVPMPEADLQPSSAPSKPKSLGIELATLDNFTPQPLRQLHHVENHHMELFMNRVNRYFPLLGSRDGINANLQFCHPPLRSAFYYAVGSVVGALERTAGEQTRKQCADNVFNMMNTAGPPGPLSERVNPPETRTWQANLVYLQIHLLLLLHHECSGAVHDDPFGTFTRDQLLQQARRMVDYLQLRHLTEARQLGSSGSEATRVFSAARRAYWVFVVLDIWNSLSGRSARMLPLMSVDAELTAHDRSLLGDQFYHFVRRSAVPAMLSDQLKILRANDTDIATTGYWMLAMLRTSTANELGNGSNSNNVSNSTTTNGTTGSASGPTLKSAPLAVLAQSTTDLFCALLTAGPTSCPPTGAVVETASKVAAQLAAVGGSSGGTVDGTEGGTTLLLEGTPLVHHFVVAATKALVDAARFPAVRPQVRLALNDLLTAVRGNGVLDTSPWREQVVAAIQDGLEEAGAGLLESGDKAVEKGVADLATAAAAAAAASSGGSDGGQNGSGIMESWKSEWPRLLWEGYLRTPI